MPATTRPSSLPFEIRESPVHGRGAFATRPIKAGARVGEYTGERISTRVADARYAVVTGDTLSKIAQRRNISGGWQALYQRNQAEVANPNALKIGQELDLD